MSADCLVLIEAVEKVLEVKSAWLQHIGTSPNGIKKAPSLWCFLLAVYLDVPNPSSRSS
jgi:hypothetical protein